MIVVDKKNNASLFLVYTKSNGGIGR